MLYAYKRLNLRPPLKRAGRQYQKKYYSEPMDREKLPETVEADAG
jgi:hypothetical protein